MTALREMPSPYSIFEGALEVCVFQAIAHFIWIVVLRSALYLWNGLGVSWALRDLGHGPPCPTRQGAALRPGHRAEGRETPGGRLRLGEGHSVEWGTGAPGLARGGVPGGVSGGSSWESWSLRTTREEWRGGGAEPGTRSAPRQPQKGHDEVGGEWLTLGPVRSPATMDSWVWGQQAGAEAGAYPAGQLPIGGHGTSCYLLASVGGSGEGAGHGDPTAVLGDLGW